MRGKRSSQPVVDYPWGGSILPGGPAPKVEAPPDAVHSPPVERPAYAITDPLPPQQFSAPPQPFGPPPPAPLPSRFGNTPEFGGAVEAPAGQRLGRPVDFANAVATPQYQFATPQPVGAPPTGAPGFGPPPQFGPPPFGTPGNSYAVPAPMYGPPAGRRLPTAAWVAISVVGGLFALGILAAIAIPVFLNQHAKPANRSVSLPATVVGQTQLDDPSLVANANQMTQTMNAPGVPWGPASTAYYGSDSVPVFAIAAAKVTARPTAHDESVFFASIEQTNLSPLTDVGVGPFGGKMKCGPVTAARGSVIQCVSIDSAAVVIIVVFQSSQDQAALLSRQIVAAVEH
jgi:hypothetical protein